MSFSIDILKPYDVDDILKIEKTLFPYPFSEKDFEELFSNNNFTGNIAKQHNKIIGYMLYETNPWGIELISLGIKKENQRQGFGRRFVDRLKRRLSLQKAKIILTLVRESNLPAQLFLKKQEFRCCKILQYHYYNELGYMFQFIKEKVNE